jgi:hypothetical protein
MPGRELAPELFEDGSGDAAVWANLLLQKLVSKHVDVRDYFNAERHLVERSSFNRANYRDTLLLGPASGDEWG